MLATSESSFDEMRMRLSTDNARRKSGSITSQYSRTTNLIKMILKYELRLEVFTWPNLCSLDLSLLFHCACGSYTNVRTVQQLPSYFNDLLIQNSALHSHNTRQSSDYHISYSRTKTRQLSISIYGAKIWNSLDQNLKSSVTLQNFKYRYKKYLLNSR